MIFLIVFGAAVLNGFLALSQVPQVSANWIGEQGFNPWVVLAIVLVFYLILGCVMDSLSMILLTIPILYPMMMVLDFGMTPDEFGIWFGIIVLIAVEVGLITPPVGMNLFIINSMSPEHQALGHLSRRVALRHQRHRPHHNSGSVPINHTLSCLVVLLGRALHAEEETAWGTIRPKTFRSPIGRN